MTSWFASLTSRLSVALVFLFGIAACGGGGGSSGDGGGGFLPNSGGGNFTITLQLLDDDGNPTNAVTSTSPATLNVTVKSGSRTQAEVVVVATADIGLIIPDSGTALTDANGVATFRIEAGEVLGAGTISVSHTPDTGDAATGTLTFQVGQPGLRIGHYQDGVFIDGELGVTDDTIPTGGTFLVNLAVVDAEGIAVSDAVEVLLTNNCTDATGTVFTSNGIASITFVVNSCTGSYTTTASLVEGSNQAVGTVFIALPTAGSISFISAMPELIALKGTGGAGRQESSEVIFQVVSGAGVPIPAANVNFSLSTSVGGVTLNNALVLSDLDGMARTSVISGNVSTPVRVIATIEVDDGSGGTLVLTTVSDILVVSTGLPDQNSISLGSVLLNVGGAMDNDGLTTEVFVRLADKFNNPVPDGTAAAFTTEYGSIGSSCVTVDGGCTVIWTSQSPRGFNDLGNVEIGRSTILVTVIGEEYFVDANGNGVYDEDELFQNLPEAFLDRNEDFAYTPASNPNDLTGTQETFVDFNNNGIYDLNTNPAWYNGILCPQEGAGIFCSRDLLNVRSQITIVMSSTSMNIELFRASSNSPTGVAVEGIEYEVRVIDDNGNRPAGDASVIVTTNQDCALISPSSFDPENTASRGPFTFPLQIEGDGEAGTFSVAVVNGGVTSTESFDCITDPNSP